MNEHWEAFVSDSCLSDSVAESAKVSAASLPGSWFPVSSEFAELFPVLHALLRKASITRVDLRGSAFILFSWASNENFSAWLSPVPVYGEENFFLHPHHRVLLSSFGGITEYAHPDEPSWILNHISVLTTKAARDDASFLQQYSWAFEKNGCSIPIVQKDFYVIAEEANGNRTICHRITGEVLLFAPDHCFHHVEIYPDCPEYTLYRIQKAKILNHWVDCIANQWIR
jgi:hypothetical protein